MPKLQVIVSHFAHETLKEMAKTKKESLSKIASQMIEIGLRIEKNRNKIGEETNNNIEELEAKHTEYLLRILGITSDILRCVNKPTDTRYGHKEAGEELNAITNNIQSYIDGFAEKFK